MAYPYEPRDGITLPALASFAIQDLGHVMGYPASSTIGKARMASVIETRKSTLLDPNSDFFRDHRRTERIVTGVTQYQLQGMLAGWQFDACLGLACAKMKM